MAFDDTPAGEIRRVPFSDTFSAFDVPDFDVTHHVGSGKMTAVWAEAHTQDRGEVWKGVCEFLSFCIKYLDRRFLFRCRFVFVSTAFVLSGDRSNPFCIGGNLHLPRPEIMDLFNGDRFADLKIVPLYDSVITCRNSKLAVKAASNTRSIAAVLGNGSPGLSDWI